LFYVHIHCFGKDKEGITDVSFANAGSIKLIIKKATKHSEIQMCDARKASFFFLRRAQKLLSAKTILEKIIAQLIFAAQQQTLFNG